MSETLEWENLSESERQAIKLISERSLLGFQRCFFQLMQGEKWDVNWHHRYMSRSVEDIVRGKRGSTIFNVPPGAGKTETLSIHAPVWAMLGCDRIRNLNISFSDTLTKRNSRRTRDIITSEEFQHLWPSPIGVNQADEWSLLGANGKTRAEVVSRSAGGQITGGRGGYTGSGFSGWICLDDVDKPQDMFSEVKRSRIHQLLVNTIRSRRGNSSKDNPTPIVAIQQRLHQYDSTWFMAGGSMGIKFDLIKIPALITEEYMASLPDWVRGECWESIKDSEFRIKAGVKYWSYWPRNVYIGDLMDLWERDEYTFISQYMQEPVALGGNIFNSDWWQFYDETQFHHGDNSPPKFDYRFITADTATKTKTYNDFSVMMEWGAYGGKLYAIDMLRGKWEAPELREAFTEFINSRFEKNSEQSGNLRAAYVEDKSSGTGLIQEVGRTSPCEIVAVQRSIDKLTRAMDTAPQIKMGKVLLPMNAPWLATFISEHSAFAADDSHKNDDIVDNTMDAVDRALLKGQDSFEEFLSLRRRR